MKTLLPALPRWIAVVAALALVCVGPIPQFAHYHEFADARVWLGVPNAADVLSNLGFLLAGVWGMGIVWRRRTILSEAFPAWMLFAASVVACAVGSTWYHLDPDDSRLIWDRLPIALVSAGLLVAFRTESRPGTESRVALVLTVAFAVGSVAWWALTNGAGSDGDLRPYLLIQSLPIVLVPLWQAIRPALRGERLAVFVALAFFALARAAELADQAVFAATGWISGHTLKHLLAAGAAAVLVAMLATRRA